jgi:hypothetical protein
MTPVVNGTILRQTVGCYLSPQVAINQVHWEVSGLVGTVSDQDCCDDLNIFAANAYIPILNINATYWGVKIQIVQTTFPKPIPVVNASLTAVGGVAGDVLPYQICGIFTKFTNNGGRIGRGRFYVAFPSEGLNTAAGQPSAAYLTLLGTLASNFCTQATITGGSGTCVLNPILYHYGAPPFPTPITGFRANPKWATQRRRGDYGKTNLIPPF